jgi:hypothetical protein
VFLVNAVVLQVEVNTRKGSKTYIQQDTGNETQIRKRDKEHQLVEIS